MVVYSERPASMYSKLQVVLHSTLLTQRSHQPPEELCLPQKRGGVDACQPDNLTV